MPDISPKARRHSWGDSINVPPGDSYNGCELTERRCALCGLVKITVHPPRGFPWREWRFASGSIKVGGLTPMCRGGAA